MDVADALCFAGGFTLGAVQSGMRLIAKREYAGGFGAPACEANRHLLGEDWVLQTSPAEEWVPVRADVVIGNPPCSGFSPVTSAHLRGMDSHINHCMWDFVAYAAACRPHTIVMESVRPAYSQGRPLMQRLREDVERRTGQAWWMTHVLEDSYSLGGCAIRSRYLMVLHRHEFGVDRMEFAPPLPTFWDAIRDLEDLPLQWEAQPHTRWRAASRWAQPLLSGEVDGHLGVTSMEVRRVEDLLARTEWREGEVLTDVCRRHWEQTGDVPPGWFDHKSVDRLRKRFAEGDFWMGVHQPKRWYRDRAARVIQGGAPFHVVHPTRDRFVTHRECLRVMGFPDDWRVEALDPRRSATYWGKGLSIQPARWIGEWVKKSLEGHPGPMTGDVIGERERVIDVSRDWREFSDHLGLPRAVPQAVPNT